MKKFSEVLPTDHDFEFQGEFFQWQYVHWSVQAQIFDDAGATNGKVPTWKETTEETIQNILLFVTEESRPRLQKMLSEKGPNAVPLGLVNALWEWLLEVTSGRPIEPPSPSVVGPGKTAATSKGR